VPEADNGAWSNHHHPTYITFVEREPGVRGLLVFLSQSSSVRRLFSYARLFKSSHLVFECCHFAI
jgi:hypothetical protein